MTTQEVRSASHDHKYISNGKGYACVCLQCEFKPKKPIISEQNLTDLGQVKHTKELSASVNLLSTNILFTRSII